MNKDLVPCMKRKIWQMAEGGGQLHHALSHKVFFVSPKVWWGHGRISALRGSGIGSLHKQSCCAWWRRNNVSSSTSCSGTAMQHILSLLPAVPCRRVITGAKSLFTWRDNALCNWLMLGERGLALLVLSCRLLLGLLHHHIIDDRRCHLMGVGQIILCGTVERGDAVWSTVGIWAEHTNMRASASHCGGFRCMCRAKADT